MPERVGPPTARNEPWNGLTSPIPGQPEPVPNRVRDAAFEAWAGQGLCVATAGERAFVKAVFCAGWEARKKASYQGVVLDF